ncbi:hypothetical protein GQ42DRAFT_30729 [Ramicandelaber brevisporus]|nr:hypothetical protein GQ42DRAFT_30729 [Ramicandelaber brevisporus]
MGEGGKELMEALCKLRKVGRSKSCCWLLWCGGGVSGKRKRKLRFGCWSRGRAVCGWSHSTITKRREHAAVWPFRRKKTTSFGSQSFLIGTQSRRQRPQLARMIGSPRSDRAQSAAVAVVAL